MARFETLLEPNTWAHLSSYERPPLFDVTLEEFESWALNRLRILSEIESASARNRPHDELKALITKLLKKYLPLNANTAVAVNTDAERRQDHVSHYVLRLAFCRSEDLRRRFVRLEGIFFRIKWELDDAKEREEFMSSRDLGMTQVSMSCICLASTISNASDNFARFLQKRRMTTRSN